MSRGISAILLAGFLFSQTLVQDIIQQLNKPNNFYGDVAPLIARMNAEAAAQSSTPPPGPSIPPASVAPDNKK